MDRKGSFVEMNATGGNESGDRRSEIDRLVGKGKAKEAFKQAKWFFNREPNGENHKLVEYTYICRIRELIRGGMTSAGREVALSALEFGVTDPVLLNELAAKLPVLGMMDKALELRDRLGLSDSAASFTESLADQAVVHPDAIKDSMPDLYAAAEPIRAAFAALDTGVETRALDSLRSIPRSSPMADWRYFIRGLIAFRKQKVDSAKNDWDRLNPSRAAKKIAQKLLAVAEIAPGDASDDQLKRLEKSAFGEPIFERIAELRAAFNKSDWKRILKLIAPVQKTLKRFDPRAGELLTQIILSTLSIEIMNSSPLKATQLIDATRASLEPLPWDPHWLRFDAVLWDGPHGDLDGALNRWKSYLKELEKGIPYFSPEESIRAQALIWRRIGSIHFHIATKEEDRKMIFGSVARRGKLKLSDNHRRSVSALERSLELDPKQRKTYEKLLDIYNHFELTTETIALFEGLLNEFPDDVEALNRLIAFYRQTDQVEKMLSTVERYRKLKPLDASAALDESCARLSLARKSTAKKNREAGRAEFNRIESAKDNPIPSYVITGCRAVFEFKSGEDERARELVERTESEAKHPASATLVLAIEAVRYGLVKSLREHFLKRFRAALSNPATSESAAELAEVMMFYAQTGVKFTGRGERLKDVIVYLGKTARLKYREKDLRLVCMFLAEFDETETFQLKFAKLGRKLFPKSAYFALHEVEMELLRDGPMGLRPKRVQKKLQAILDLIDPAGPPQDAQLIPKIKDMIHRMADLDRPGFEFPWMSDEGPECSDDDRDMFGEFFSQFAQMNFGFDDDDEHDDFDDDDDEPAPQRRKASSKRKRR